MDLDISLYKSECLVGFFSYVTDVYTPNEVIRDSGRPRGILQKGHFPGLYCAECTYRLQEYTTLQTDLRSKYVECSYLIHLYYEYIYLSFLSRGNGGLKSSYMQDLAF